MAADWPGTSKCNDRLFVLDDCSSPKLLDCGLLRGGGSRCISVCCGICEKGLWKCEISTGVSSPEARRCERIIGGMDILSMSSMGVGDIDRSLKDFALLRPFSSFLSSWDSFSSVISSSSSESDPVTMMIRDADPGLLQSIVVQLCMPESKSEDFLWTLAGSLTPFECSLLVSFS